MLRGEARASDSLGVPHDTSTPRLCSHYCATPRLHHRSHIPGRRIARDKPLDEAVGNEGGKIWMVKKMIKVRVHLVLGLISCDYSSQACNQGGKRESESGSG